MSEGLTKSALARWTHHEDSKTSALGFIAFGIVYGCVIPIWFGIAWLIAWLSHGAWEAWSTTTRPRVWPYIAAATAAALFFVTGRPLGVDLWIIHTLARFLETATGGWFAPAALSRWYAAGWVSWMEFQIVLGLALGGWRTYAWGWEAPAVRRDARGRAPQSDRRVRIISDASPPPRAAGSESPAATSRSDETDRDPIKIISGGTA